MRDERNIMRTTSLFWETKREANPEFAPMYTLRHDDYTVGDKTYISMKKIYMSYDHIPGFEYDFAMDVFGSWEHWEKITRSSFRSHIVAWREELDVRLKAEAMKQMIYASKGDDARGVAAAKYLADKGYVPKKVGRHSKAELERERRIEAGVNKDLADDMERLNLHVVAKGVK